MWPHASDLDLFKHHVFCYLPIYHYLSVCPAGKPYNMASSERVQLSGTYNVRKGKLQLPVNRWSRRHVILCGTCLMVSSIKASHAGKMHILPLIGGKVKA